MNMEVLCICFSEAIMNVTVLQQSFSKHDLRTVIKFHVLLKRNATEIHQIMTDALGEVCPSYETIRRWVNAILQGKTDVGDECRSGRPVSASTADIVEKIEELLQEDRRITTRQIAYALDISKDTAHHILTDTLGKRKICAKWVPHILTEEQRQCRMTTCAAHLRKFRREGRNFLRRIVACDETWAYSWQPELKSQSSEWCDPGSPRPTKAIRKQGSLKVMHITFFDLEGIIFDEAVPVGQTVNGDYYLSVLRNKVRRAIRDKRPLLQEKGVILLQDNAAPHRKKGVLEAMEQWGWKTLAHPPYSPDLSPCDYFLFPKVKEIIRGRRFNDEESINAAFAAALRDVTASGIQPGIERLPHRWQKCVDLDGSYVE